MKSRGKPIRPEAFGISIPYTAVEEDAAWVLREMGRRLRAQMREALDLEADLSFLRARYPQRAHRWAAALVEYETWLGQVFPPQPSEVCVACGRPWDDEDEW